MDSFDLKPERQSKVNGRALLWNVLTVVMLLGIVGMCVFFASIFLNPNSLLNPFPPQPLPTVFTTPTATITPIQLQPTWTPTVTLEPSPSRTTAPTWTPLPGMISPTPSETPTVGPPSAGGVSPSPTSNQPGGPALAAADITYKPSTTYHPDSDCKWLGVGGQVQDSTGQPLPYQTLYLGGSLNGSAVDHRPLSGTAPAYGKGGFEIVLGDHPIASTHSLWIQLFDNNGKQMTGQIFFDTYADCNKNLVMIVFTKK